MRLRDRRIGMFVGPGFEDLELWVTRMRCEEEGAEVVMIGERAGETHASKSGGLHATSDVAAEDVQAKAFDALVVPGGWCPDKIRRNEAILKLVRDACTAGRIVAAICHGGSVLISAGVVAGRRATGSLGIKDDLVNAGATWVDEPAFREGNLVWGRVVPDIPAFCRELVAAVESARPDSRVRGRKRSRPSVRVPPRSGRKR